MTSHVEIMHSLKDKLSDIEKSVPAGSTIIYFDYPLHFNVGDQLIYLGTLDFFDEHDYVVKGYYSEHNLDIGSLTDVCSDTIILLHGGGNFGDLYPKHQIFREKIVKKFPNNRIVVLPQTIHFEDAGIENTSASIFKKHGDIVIYARDKKSYQSALKFSDNSFLMPDMAHQLWDTPFFKKNKYISDKSEKQGTLLQERIDFESAGLSLTNKYSNKVTFDWYELFPYWIYKSCSVLSFLSRHTKNHSFMSKLINYFWILISKECIKLSANKINAHHNFITTRLHGHIFAQLISHPHIILDNNYGKIKNYADCWTIQSDNVKKGSH